MTEGSQKKEKNEKNIVVRTLHILKKPVDFIDDICFAAGAKLATGISRIMVGSIFTFIFPLELQEAVEMVRKGRREKKNAMVGVGILSAIIATAGLGIATSLWLDGAGLISATGAYLYPLIIVSSLFTIYAAHLALKAYEVWKSGENLSATTKLTSKENEAEAQSENTHLAEVTPASDKEKAVKIHAYAYEMEKIELKAKSVELLATSMVLVGVVLTTENLTQVNLGQIDFGFTELEGAAMFLICGAVLGLVTKFTLVMMERQHEKNNPEVQSVSPA